MEKHIITDQLIKHAIKNKVTVINPSIHYVFKGMVFRVEIIKSKGSSKLIHIYPVGDINELPKVESFRRYNNTFSKHYTKRTTNIDSDMYNFLLKINVVTQNGLPLYSKAVV